MNYPPVTFELKEKYLLVIGHGARKNLAAISEAAAQIYSKIQETESRYLLVDYTELKINLHLNDAFNIVKRYETSHPGLKNVIISVAFGVNSVEFVQYWKEIGKQRGFFIEIFKDLKEAEKWLLEQIALDIR
jgi:hypothetical protein